MTWVAPAGWAGKGGPIDGTEINPWYGLFPQEWVDGSSTGEIDIHRSGELWERRRRALQRLGDCCIRMCADLWSMACFLWTAPDRIAQGAERSKRGRAGAREAASLQAADRARSGLYANGGWNRRRKMRRGIGAKARVAGGTEEGKGNNDF